MDQSTPRFLTRNAAAAVVSLGLGGLTEEEAGRRLAAEGPNELPSAKKRGPFAIALEVIKEPMFLLLIACGSLYLLLGDVKEALLLLGFVFVVVGITFVQERKTERALDALRDLSSPRALVVRSGEKKRIAGRDVVRGDVLLLSEGDRVPADAAVRSATSLSVDESLLTGESVPVGKSSVGGPVEMGRPGGDDTPFVYSGTLVVKGQGVAEVLSIGAATEMGKIGKALAVLQPEDTPLQRETARLVRLFAFIGLGLCLTVVTVYTITRGDFLKGLLAGLTLGMAMLPEEFPVVLTVFLALGAWRISQHHVLTRRMPAVETIGSATALCVDKTGTLTMNRMTVADLAVGEEGLAVEPAGTLLPETFHELVEFAILASPEDPFDPMEKAMRELGERTLAGTEHLHRDWELLREYPLSRELLAMSRVWRSPDRSEHVIAAKGAPEAIADLCHLSAEETAALDRRIAALAGKGRRVLGVARATFGTGTELPGGQHDFRFPARRPPRPLRPRAARRPGGDRRVPQGRHPGAHDHGRLPRHRPEHRPRDRAGGAGERHHGTGARGNGRRDARRARPGGPPLRPDGARAEAPPRFGPQGQRRDRGDDRRRRQRRPGPEGRPHRDRNGRPRDGRCARIGCARPPRRFVRLDREGGEDGAPDLRQPPEGDALHLRRPRPDRRALARAGPPRVAPGAPADPHRLPRADHRPGLHRRLRGRGGRTRRHGSPAPPPRRAAPRRPRPAAGPRPGARSLRRERGSFRLGARRHTASPWPALSPLPRWSSGTSGSSC